MVRSQLGGRYPKLGPDTKNAGLVYRDEGLSHCTSRRENPASIFVFDTELGVGNGCPGWDRTGASDMAFIG